MNIVVKVVVVVVLVMGVFSFVNVVGSNIGMVIFIGIIEDLLCLIVVGDEYQIVNLGYIGIGFLMGGKEFLKVDFYIGLENCVFIIEKEVFIVFFVIGNEFSVNLGSVVLMCIGGGEMVGFSIVIGNYLGFVIKLGDVYSENLMMNGSVVVVKQIFNFKVWVKGDFFVSIIDIGEFSSIVNFMISYL